MPLPLDVTIESLTVRDAALDQGEGHWPLERLELRGSIAGGRLELETLSAAAPQGSARISGEAGLGGDWPLELSLEVASGRYPGGGEQRLHTRLAGSLADLAVTLRAEGPVAADLEAEAALFTEGVPWRLRLSAPALDWPLTGEPTVRLREAEIRGSGTVADWAVELKAGVDGPDIPAGRWRAEAAGDLAGARLRSLTGDILDGRVDAEGEVQWADGIRWSLSADAQGVDPTPLGAPPLGLERLRLQARGTDTGARIEALNARLLAGEVNAEATAEWADGIQWSGDRGWRGAGSREPRRTRPSPWSASSYAPTGMPAARVERLDAQLLGGELTISGEAGWSDGLRWRAQARADGIDPGRYRDDLPGRLGGAVTSEGHLADGELALTVEIPGIEGELRGYPLALNGAVRREAGGRGASMPSGYAPGPTRSPWTASWRSNGTHVRGSRCRSSPAFGRASRAPWRGSCT
ncbi:MAG: hypothetical protein U5L11_08080 [Arhodomonas sp.]|nr:hypothetical protein [Arhodomonas sp.]